MATKPNQRGREQEASFIIRKLDACEVVMFSRCLQAAIARHAPDTRQEEAGGSCSARQKSLSDAAI